MDGFILPANQTKSENYNKQTYLNHLLSRLEVDVFGGAETRQQFDLLPQTHSLDRQLDLREGSRCQTSHNTHE